MADLYRGMESGADNQSEAVLAYLRQRDGIDYSWDSERNRYLAEPKVARWHNGREQGYVVYLKSNDHSRQINIAFFEHRNSDQICAVEWEQRTLNPPTIDTAEFVGVYKDKWDVSHTEVLGRAMEMADWINERLDAFWAGEAK